MCFCLFLQIPHRKMDNVNQANYDYLADIQDILLKMDGK